jgi:hypothetical protein
VHVAALRQIGDFLRKLAFADGIEIAPSKVTLPPSGARRSASTRSSVVLPEPFGADQPDHFAGCDRKIDMPQHRGLPETHGDAGLRASSVLAAQAPDQMNRNGAPIRRSRRQASTRGEPAIAAP